MKIGLVTVNYHSDQDTLDLVNSLSQCVVPSGIEVTTYIVDNSRSDKLKKSLVKTKNTVYVESSGNVGFASGYNIGLKKVIAEESDIIVIINNDTLVEKSFFLNILSSPITDDKVGVVSGLIYFAKGFEFKNNYKKEDLGKVIWYAGSKYDKNNVYVSHIGVDEVDKGQYNQIKDVDLITGCLFITKLEVLKKVGLFDERYCLYFEDSDLAMRIKKASYKLMLDPSIKLWHKVAQSSGIGSPLNDYFLTRNRLLFGFTYTNFRTKFALIRESIKKLITGTKAQKQAVKDFFTGNLGWGSWKN